MAHSLDVPFRGEQREVEFEYEGDDVIVWSFFGENVCSGVDTTQEEQDAIYALLWEYMLDWWGDQ